MCGGQYLLRGVAVSFVRVLVLAASLVIVTFQLLQNGFQMGLLSHFDKDFLPLLVRLGTFQRNAIRNHIPVLQQDLDEIETVVAKQKDQVILALAITPRVSQNLE